jgi:glycosyltransferase involved in cell wall biosynthesis
MSIHSVEQLIQDLTSRHRVNGINVCGYLRTESGVGSATRSYVRALRSLSIPVVLRDLSEISGNRAKDQTFMAESQEHWHDVNLICVDVDLHYAATLYLGDDFFEGRYNIGVWWWELPNFPCKWRDRFAHYDEIWVGSSFIANAVAPVAPMPVVRIPPVLTPVETGVRERGRLRLGLSPDEYVYLFVFDFHSHIQRKNPLAVIEAFKRAFAPSHAPSQSVRLIIKCVNGDSNPDGFARMMSEAQGYPISIFDGYWSATEIRDLMTACDVYVSLHRSEGAGLTITDAMALGKPVIATGWSGNMDFMNVRNSFPVRYELVELQENVGPYTASEIWAEPSVEHAAELMRFVYTNRQESSAHGQVAQQEIETMYSAEAVGALIQQRLEAITLRRQFPAFRQEVQEHYRRYRQLPDRIQAIVRRLLPPNSIVLVVSKGDETLIRLEGHTGWHFPQNEMGKYAGYYPATSEDAIAHLEELRKKGAGFLLFPQSALWWLEHYLAFREHLEEHYALVTDTGNSCLIFALCERASELAGSTTEMREHSSTAMPV